MTFRELSLLFMNRSVIILLISYIIGVSPLTATSWFVASDGLDINSGTISAPFKTITKAVSVMTAGDTVFVRGGTYPLSTTISISKKGSASVRYYLLAYPGERPLLDFSGMAFSSSNRAFNFNGWYWTVRGLDIKGAGDNGMNLSGSYNTIDNCTFFENRDTGLQLSNGASNNSIINCDSYYNADPGNGNADGFAPKLDVGTNNYFFGCRAWQNSDDGWDGYMRGANDVTTTYEQCWVFKNGYLKNGSASAGNGNGFKMGGGDTSNISNWAHNVVMKNCLAFENRVKGFDQNNNAGSMLLLNCTGYANGTNYSVIRDLKPGKTFVIKNCVSLGPYGSFGNFAQQEKNSWIAPFDATSDDFVSVDPAVAYGPRKSDGTLPDISFLHLKQGSDLIDAGVNVGIPFNGAAPDLGAFEYSGSTGVHNERGPLPQEFTLEQNFPNPFNPTTTIRYHVPQRTFLTVTVYDMLGRETALLVDGEQEAGSHTVQFNATGYSSGLYFYQLRSGTGTIMKSMILVK